jgi:hypothetical protein
MGAYSTNTVDSDRQLICQLSEAWHAGRFGRQIRATQQTARQASGRVVGEDPEDGLIRAKRPPGENRRPAAADAPAGEMMK